MPELNLARILSNVKYALKTFPREAGNKVVFHFLASFRNEAWEGEKWQPRSRPDKTKRGKIKKKQRNLLVKTRTLRRSIGVVETGFCYVKIATDIPYAEIHNKGGVISTTQSVPAHSRAAHSRNQKGKKVQVQAHTVQAHTRKVNTTIPQRQFMGNSETLNKEIQEYLDKQIIYIFATI